MNCNPSNKENETLPPQVPHSEWIGLFRKAWACRKLILTSCAIGAAIALIIIIGTPRQYTASTLIAPEGYAKSSASSMGKLAALAGLSSNSSDDRDAIFPSLYPRIVRSAPFITRLFDLKVRPQHTTDAITLAQYIKEHQQKPWWSAITSAPSALIRWGLSLFSSTDDKKEKQQLQESEKEIDPFRLTRLQAGIAGSIASKIKFKVDQEKRTFTMQVTMQDPQVAATLADTLIMMLKEYTIEYRTAKALKILAYTEKSCKEAQLAYYKAQKEYTRYADANRDLSLLVSRGDLAQLRNKMSLALAAYQKMELQVNIAQARVKKETPVYAVIQPVTVPLYPVKPRKAMILAGCILLSAIGSIGWVLFGTKIVSTLKRIAQQPQPHKKKRRDD